MVIVGEKYYAVLCRYVHPSTSMAHEETWYGPFELYVTAEQVIKNELDNEASSRFQSGHVCKRFVKVVA